MDKASALATLEAMGKHAIVIHSKRRLVELINHRTPGPSLLVCTESVHRHDAVCGSRTKRSLLDSKVAMLPFTIIAIAAAVTIESEYICCKGWS